MKSTPRTMKLLGSTAILASLAAGYFLVIAPFSEERSITAQEMQDAKSSVERLEGELSSITLVRDGIAEIQSIDAEVSRAFPSASQIPQFTNDVLAAAGRAGLSPDAITSVTAEVPTLVAPTVPAAPAEGTVPSEEDASTPEATEDPTNLETQTDPTSVSAQSSLAEMNVSIAAVGTTEQLAAFLRELSNMERAYLISNATLAGEPGESGSLAVTGKTFLYKPVIFPTDDLATEESGTSETPIEGEIQP